MTDRDVIELIFLPGFSTAEKVTNVSGRGVGMDVVKTNIEKIGGTVDIQSRPGHGTTLTHQDPADAGHHPGADRHQRRRALSRSRRSACSSSSASKASRPTAASSASTARRSTACAATCCRSSYLDQRAASSSGRRRDDDVVNIVVLQADDRQFGLVVDAINDTEEIVVKPLGKQLKGIPSFAGATIMGDGRVALILDVLGSPSAPAWSRE